MRHHLTESAFPGTASAYRGPQAPNGATSALSPAELAAWLDRRLERIAGRWYQDLERRGTLGDGPMPDLLERFIQLLVAFLPELVGAGREHVEPAWAEASELFGTLGAKRGLASGEVVEEFQVLREAVIRLLYQDPPLGGTVPLSLREVLRLNRAIDRGVTHANVGHTDALFFALFEGSGVPEAREAEDLVAEVEGQLVAIEHQLRAAPKHPTGDRRGAGPRNP